MNNKIKSILGSVLVIAIAASMMTFGTQSYLSDSEKSEGNILQAGELDLRIDLMSSYWYDAAGNLLDEPIEFEETNLTIEKFFNWSDIKPGDWGEMTISLHVYDNDALLWFNISNIMDLENGINNPESKVPDDTPEDGELDDHLRFYIWLDDGDNIRQDDEPLLFDWTYLNEIDEPFELWNFYTELNGWYMEACTTYYIGIYWELPPETGNIIQGDSWGADLEFYVEQYRNNPLLQPPD